MDINEIKNKISKRMGCTSADLMSHLHSEFDKYTNELLDKAEAVIGFGTESATKAGKNFIDSFMPEINKAISAALPSGQVVSMIRDIDNNIKCMTEEGDVIVGKVIEGSAVFNTTMNEIPQIITLAGENISMEELGKAIADQSKLTDLMTHLSTFTTEGKWDANTIERKLAPYITDLDARGKALYSQVMENMQRCPDKLEGKVLLETFARFLKKGLNSSENTTNSVIDWNESDFGVKASFTWPVSQIINTISGAMAILGGPITKIVGIAVFGISTAYSKAKEWIANNGTPNCVLNYEYDAPCYAQPILSYETNWFGGHDASEVLASVENYGKIYTPYTVTYIWPANDECTRLRAEVYVLLNIAPKEYIELKDDENTEQVSDLVSHICFKGDFINRPVSDETECIFKSPDYGDPTDIFNGYSSKEIQEHELSECIFLNQSEESLISNLSDRSWFKIFGYNFLMAVRNMLYDEIRIGESQRQEPIVFVNSETSWPYNPSWDKAKSGRFMINQIGALCNLIIEITQTPGMWDHYASTGYGELHPWYQATHLLTSVNEASRNTNFDNRYPVFNISSVYKSGKKYNNTEHNDYHFYAQYGIPSWNPDELVSWTWAYLPVAGVFSKGNAFLYPPKYTRAAWINAAMISITVVSAVLAFTAYKAIRKVHCRKTAALDEKRVKDAKLAYQNDPSKSNYKAYKKELRRYNRRTSYYGGGTLNISSPATSRALNEDYLNGILSKASSLNDPEVIDPVDDDKPVTLDVLLHLIKG